MNSKPNFSVHMVFIRFCAMAHLQETSGRIDQNIEILGFTECVKKSPLFSHKFNYSDVQRERLIFERYPYFSSCIENFRKSEKQKKSKPKLEYEWHKSSPAAFVWFHHCNLLSFLTGNIQLQFTILQFVWFFSFFLILANASTC